MSSYLLFLQDTIRSIVWDSCMNLKNQIKQFSANIDPHSDWTWGEDLITSEFPVPAGLTPIWTIELYMDPVEGPKFTQPLSTFCRNVYKVFNKAIKACSGMKTVESQKTTFQNLILLKFKVGNLSSSLQLSVVEPCHAPNAICCTGIFERD